MAFAGRESLRYFAEEIVGLKLQPGQERFVDLVDSDFERLRTLVVRKGRRCGMTACAGLLAAWCGTVLAPRFREHVLPGEEYAVTLVATSREQAGVALGFVRRFLASSPLLSDQVVSHTADTLTLAGGCVVEAIPCSARSSRGRANGLVICDEAAHFVDSVGNQSLAAVLDALTPPLAQFGPLGLLVAISTPLDASGAFHELDLQASSGRFPELAALHISTIEGAPHLAAEAQREELRNPIRFRREWLGEYASGDESFPLAVFDQCVDPTYAPPLTDPGRAVVLALDGSVNRDATALVGVDADWNLVYARAWYPPRGGSIDHHEVLCELVEIAGRFHTVAIAYDPAQIHGLVLDALQCGLPMLPVSQAGGRHGGTMARHTAALIEALHERRLRLYPDAELRKHVAAARFSARAGGERLVKARASDAIDLAVALAMAVGVRTDLELRLLHERELAGVETLSAAEYLLLEAPERVWVWDIFQYHPGPVQQGWEPP